MTKPRFCLTEGGYRRQAKELSSDELLQILNTYDRDPKITGRFFAMFDGPPKICGSI